ncbi:LuxR family transcriptional regulator [Micromonospora sonneratiae]
MTQLLGPASGSARVVVVDGDAGIGKTRLLTEYAHRARRRRTRVLAGRATEFEREVPYGLFLDVLGAATDPGIGPLATLTTCVEIASRGPVDRAEQFRTHRRVCSLLAVAAQPAGAVLLFDDVHLADGASIDLLAYILRHPPVGPLVFVLTVRCGQYPQRLTEAIGRADPPPLHLSLSPLSTADVDSWLEVHEAARSRLLEQLAGGNPLYLEILDNLDPASLDALAGGDLPEVNPGSMVRRAIETDLCCLEQVEREVLQAAAVLGPNLSLDALAHVAEQPTHRTAAALDVLAGRGLLRQVDGRLGFRHPLVRMAAYWLSGPGWRIRAHARAAAYLQGCGVLPVQLAHHLVHGIRTGDVPGARTLARAASGVLGTAPATSARWLRVALGALPDRVDLVELRAKLRLRYAEALRLSGQLDDARAVLSELADQRSTDRYAAIWKLAGVQRLFGQHARARALLTRELDELDGEDRDGTELALELAINEMHEGIWSAASSHARTAVRSPIAQERGILAAAHTVLAACALAGGPLAQAREEITTAATVIDEAEEGDLRDDLGVFAVLAWVEHFVDRREEALRHAERGLRIARRYGRTHLVPHLLTARAVVQSGRGRVGEALDDAVEAQELARAQENAESLSLATAVGLIPLLWQSGPKAVAEVLDRLRLTAAPRSTLYRAIAGTHVAEACLAVGDGAGGWSVLTDMAGGPETTIGPASAVTFALRAVAGEPAIGPPRLDRARTLAGDVASQLGYVELASAGLALRAGTPPDAIGHALPAVEHFTRAGTPVREGQARLQLAEAYAATGDTASARQQLGTAKQLFTRCGAGWLAQQAGIAQRRLAAQLPRSTGAGVLSRRERQVAELVAIGLTNQQIGSRLVVSPRTVECHVARIMSKLRVPNRAAVGLYLDGPDSDPAGPSPGAGTGGQPPQPGRCRRGCVVEE